MKTPGGKTIEMEQIEKYKKRKRARNENRYTQNIRTKNNSQEYMTKKKIVSAKMIKMGHFYKLLH